MTILQEIQKWSLTLPEWQQHAVAVLYKRPTLETTDIEHIYALLKLSKGIPDPEQREASKLTEDQVASPEQDAPVVKLQSIKNLQGINALARGKTLPLASEGLSIIYGDNGAGKSGYSRLLKQACRARDQDEKIRANIFLENHSSITASAKFDILVDGTTAEVGWENGSIPPPELASIAIFDSRCARAYLDNEGDFAYVPYGLDILSGLGRLCEQLKVKTEHERALIVPNLNAFQNYLNLTQRLARSSDHYQQQHAKKRLKDWRHLIKKT